MGNESVPVRWVCFCEWEIATNPHTVSDLTSSLSLPSSGYSVCESGRRPPRRYEYEGSMRRGFGGGRCGGSPPHKGGPKARPPLK